jgi:hypothetical protein
VRAGAGLGRIGTCCSQTSVHPRPKAID